MFIDLKNPLVFFDFETTGVNVSRDRIIEYCFIKLNPDSSSETKAGRLNPEMPIPAESTKIHGIVDEDVKDEPTFKQKADELNVFLKKCDFAGFNSNKFDFPMLVEEFLRVEKEFETEGRKFIDVQRIFHQMEPRNLIAAYKFYCEKDLTDAHNATADTEATLEVFKSQLLKYQQLEKNVDFLHKFSGQSDMVDLAGRMVLNEKGEPTFNFGKHKGKTVLSIFKTDPSYYDWMMKNDFPLQTKKVLTQLRLKEFGKK